MPLWDPPITAVGLGPVSWLCLVSQLQVGSGVAHEDEDTRFEVGVRDRVLVLAFELSDRSETMISAVERTGSMPCAMKGEWPPDLRVVA